MRKRKSAVLGIMIAVGISLVGCGGKEEKPMETMAPIETIHPTESVTEATEESKLGEALVIEEVQAPVMISVQEESLSMETSESLSEETSENEAGSVNSLENENNSAQLNESETEQTVPVYPDETLSHEQMQNIENSVREYTRKQAEDLLKDIDW